MNRRNVGFAHTMGPNSLGSSNLLHELLRFYVIISSFLINFIYFEKATKLWCNLPLSYMTLLGNFCGFLRRAELYINQKNRFFFWKVWKKISIVKSLEHRIAKLRKALAPLWQTYVLHMMDLCHLQTLI